MTNLLLCGCEPHGHKCLISERGCGRCFEHCVCTPSMPTSKNNPITQSVNTIIQVKMEERNLSRADMARRLEISPVTVTKALNDPHRDWRITTLDDWANALNCDLHIEFRRRQDEPEALRKEKYGF